jgi:hypothetical protein
LSDAADGVAANIGNEISPRARSSPGRP